MESGLEDRNNAAGASAEIVLGAVSMESGLEDRNNIAAATALRSGVGDVSMESGLEDRNNWGGSNSCRTFMYSLNGVRPRRPEQSTASTDG